MNSYGSLISTKGTKTTHRYTQETYKSDCNFMMAF
jgi:hypothetical protein